MAIYSIVKDFVETIAGFGCPETVRKGIVDHQFLRAVYILLVNERREKIAEVVLRIDWEKHRVLGSVDGMDSFEVVQGRSVTEQISRALERVKTFVGDLRRTPGVKAEVWYGVRTDGASAYEEACNLLGLTTGGVRELEWAKGRYVRATFSAARLEELQVEIRRRID